MAVSDIALRHMGSERIGDQDHADDQEAEGEDFLTVGCALDERGDRARGDHVAMGAE